MQQPISFRVIAGIMLLALGTRGAYISYNHYVNSDSVWTFQARAALHAAKEIRGDHTPTPGSSHQDAEAMFVHGVNGQTYLHLLIWQLCGTSSYVHMQWLQLLIDTLLTWPILLIGCLIGNKRVGLLAGITYAVFLPQLWLAVVPGYDFWATVGFIGSTYFCLVGFHQLPTNKANGCIYLLMGAFAAGLAACVRPTVILYPIFLTSMFGLSAFRNWRGNFLAGSMTVIGLCCGYLPVLIDNYVTYGQSCRPPSVTAHQFWCGVGQYPNSYGVVDDDGSILEFYERLTGRNGPKYQYSEDYVNVLKDQALTYVLAHPLHYTGCVIRRGVLIYSGMGLRQARLDADIWKTHADIVARRDLRGRDISRYGYIIGTLRYLARYPLLYALYPLLLLPVIGMMWSLLRERRLIVCLAATPLLYTICVFAPYYYCERCVIAAYAAAIPVWILGLDRLWDQCRSGITSRFAMWMKNRNMTHMPNNAAGASSMAA